jgi:hypothetical protein
MIFSDYNQMIGKQTFNFNHKNQFNIDKVLIEILSETNSGDKIYQDIEQIPKILLPKELMTRIAPCPIPEWFFKDGERAYRENDDVKMISEIPTSKNDDDEDRLNYFFENIDLERRERQGFGKKNYYAALTSNNIVEDSLIFELNNEYISNIKNKKSFLFSSERIDSLCEIIIKNLEIKRLKEELKSFLYIESILYLNCVQKSKKLKNSAGHIINTSFYKTYVMKNFVIKYGEILFGKSASKTGDFKPYDAFIEKLNHQPKEFGLYAPYMDYMFNCKDDKFFENFRKCIEKGSPTSNKSGIDFLKYMGVKISNDRDLMWKYLAMKLLNYTKK